VNLGIARTSGLSHDPLNYLQRSITRSRHLDKLAKRHVMHTIRKVKADGPYPLEDSVTRALWVRAYAESIRLQQKLDTLDVMDKAYKPTVWALCKLSEVLAKFRTRKGDAANRHAARQAAGNAPVWPKSDAAPVPQQGNVGVA
jgi:hypothetical protein